MGTVLIPSAVYFSKNSIYMVPLLDTLRKAVFQEKKKKESEYETSWLILRNMLTLETEHSITSLNVKLLQAFWPVHLGMHRGQRSTSASSNILRLVFLTWSSFIWLVWLVNEFQGSPGLCLPRAVITDAPPSPTFFVGAGYRNTGSHACTQSAWPWSHLPSPLLRLFLNLR